MTDNKNIHSTMLTEQQDVLKTIKKCRDNVKNFEKTCNFDTCRTLVDEIILSINNFTTKYRKDLTPDSTYTFDTLVDSYRSKIKTYEYFQILNNKKKNITNFRTDMIFKQRRKTTSDDVRLPTEAEGETNDYVVVPKDTINDNIKEIIEICDFLINDFDTFDSNRFRVIQDESFNIISEKSFFVDNNFISENHKNDLKIMKKEFESLYFDDKSGKELCGHVKELNDEIKFIKSEYSKKYKKYSALKNLYESIKKQK
jgi:hypothetical protein